MPILKTKDYKKFEIDGAEIPFSCLDRCLPEDQVCQGGGPENKKIWITTTRAKYPPLVGILDVTNKTRYGFTAKNVPIYLFHPMNKAFPPFRVGSTTEPNQNVLAVIAFESWDLNQSLPRGSCQQILGPVGDYLAEAEALYWLYSPFTAYTKKQSLSLEPVSYDVENRMDITDWPTFNVDPAGCRDIDDVFSYRQRADGSVDCIITIADVAEILPENHPIDLIAKATGQSLYQDGRKPRHMLPADLAEDYGSLVTDRERLGLSLIFTLTNNKVFSTVFRETVVKNKETFTYESINNTGHKDILRTLCEVFTPDTDASDSHNWIAALMIFYNKEMALRLKDWSAGICRSHKAPNEEKMKILEKIDPTLKFLAMSSAEYISAGAPETRHHGLNAEIYCHATSPLRRYADIQNQRVWKWIIRENHDITSNDYLLELLNTASKAAKKHDRDYTFLVALQSLRPTTDDIIEGYLLDYTHNDTTAKLEIYVPSWQKSIKIKYPFISADTSIKIKTRDEKSEMEFKKGDKIRAAISFDASRPYWKERMIFRILS
uniref:DIS3-like exonuclease 1 n=1 Tax=viral metagenome TaxID=1070528 RepID=A0A6C0BHG6_9ZZZZ